MRLNMLLSVIATASFVASPALENRPDSRSFRLGRVGAALLSKGGGHRWHSGAVG
jgi:hypothetical protein